MQLSPRFSSTPSEEPKITLESPWLRRQRSSLNQAKLVNVTAAPLLDTDLADADNYAIPTDDPVNFVAFRPGHAARSPSINQRSVEGCFGRSRVRTAVFRSGAAEHTVNSERKRKGA
jgi:hypothetical protein